MKIKTASELDIFASARKFADNLCGLTEPAAGFKSKTKGAVLRKNALKMLSELIDGLTCSNFHDPRMKIKRAALVLRVIKWDLCESLENGEISLRNFSALISSARETESMIGSILSPLNRASFYRN